MPDAHDNAITLEGLRYRVEAVESDFKKNGDTHKDLYDKLNKQNENYARLDERFSGMDNSLGRLEKSLEIVSNKIDTLTNAPAKKWNIVVTATITTVVGAVIGAVCTTIFGG